MFVHLTSAADERRVRRAGLRAASRGQDGARGVHCFPVLPSYTLTHQWLGEIARFGTRGGLVAVQVRLDDAQPVLVGHYRDRARGAQAAVPAAEAVRRVAALDDPRGWEVFVPRAVRAAEIHRIRRAPRALGWRHVPDAHGSRPCTCCGCRQPGTYGSRRLRTRLPHPLDGPPPPVPALLARLSADADSASLKDTLHWFGLRRRGPVPALAPLADHPDPEVREALVSAVSGWSTPGTLDLLAALARDPSPDVRESLVWALSHHPGPRGAFLLDSLAADPSPAVREAVALVREDEEP
ncbi:HEAT repeat domain-containing protein [Streptacidiphilus pinicola]|uniref:HEAT repeat domain-containing protein n=2 Tax=Streptacidiphilus pinicola TaxID=2219663 RepID=A0A2X0IKL4_9ACTN|nr:HEAT repeat domain-containing protein [Streptacidiphilus pinicola]